MTQHPMDIILMTHYPAIKRTLTVFANLTILSIRLYQLF